MKKLKLIVSDLAVADLTNIWLYIADYSPQAADQFMEIVFQKCSLLSISPGMGRPREELLSGIRSLAVKRYIIFYREKGDTLEIVRVLSGYRDLDALF